jgi:hypothetical protein
MTVSEQLDARLVVDGVVTGSPDSRLVEETHEGPPSAARRSLDRPGGYPRKMRDIDIRLALDKELRCHHAFDDDTLIRHEFGLQEGRRRIDVAVLNGSLSGWEIKSDVDTLVRLAGQADVYGRVLDFVTIVTTSRYVDRATAMLPDWWGVVVAEWDGDTVVLKETRPARFNDGVDAMSLAQLLWRDEALDILKRLGQGRGLSAKARWYVWDRLVTSLPLPELRTVVRERVKGRQDWPGGQLPLPRDATSRTHATA